MSDPSEWIQDRIASDPKIRAVAEDAKVFGELRDQRGWQRLVERLANEKDEYMLDIAARLLANKEVPQREIDFMAGFYKGADYVLKHPEKAEESFVKASRLAWVMQSEEAAQSTVKEPSPYA